MEPRLYVLLALIHIVKVNAELYDGKKLGCLLAPEICTPPEDCDSATGNCGIPYQGRGWEKPYEDDFSSLVRLVEILQSRGYDIDVDDFIRSLISERRNVNVRPDSWYGVGDPDFSDEVSDIELFPFGKADMVQSSRELRRSVASDPSLLKKVEVDATGASNTINNNERLQHVKSLVRDAELALAEKGKTLKDLTSQQRKALVVYLAKLFNKEEAEKKALKTSNQPAAQSGKANKTLNGISNKTETVKAVQPASAVVLQEQPAEFEEIVAQPREFNDVGSVSKSPVDSADPPKPPTSKKEITPSKMDTLYIVIIVVGATVLLIILVTIVSCIVYTYRIRNDQNKKFIGSTVDYTAETVGEDYQDICRQHYASINSEANENHPEITDSVSAAQDPLITRTYPLTKPTGNDSDSKHQDAASLSSYANATRNSSVSSVSWSEEPVTANLDITTGHAVLSYMEDHLNNKDRLDKEWEEICGYEAENVTTMAAISSQNSRKNRSMLALPYDHNRIKLNSDSNHLHSDYINASAIIDNDPKRPLYIATQGPLPSTIPDFWQMMWEKGCVAIVMLTPLVEEGVNQCARYWPDEGSCTYHNFEIHLVSEHIWCEDYLVRSLYLKHLETGETRTVTQFHFLSWPKDRVPSTPKPLLELRRKVTKCYKGHNSPVLVHCSDGIGRTGTYILLDLAIDRMLKGAKEIDIAATLEHIRDQRVGMVANKEQFEFALTAVAEEVNAILKTLLH